MSQPAPDDDGLGRRHYAADPRADGARRIVEIGATVVTILRCVDGVRMRLGVPVSAYRGLVVAVRAPGGFATLALRHADDELDIMLAEGEPALVARRAAAWSRALGKPVSVEQACVALGTVQPRGGRLPAERRSRFARRRKPGLVARMERSFAAEHEIIARD